MYSSAWAYGREADRNLVTQFEAGKSDGEARKLAPFKWTDAFLIESDAGQARPRVSTMLALVSRTNQIAKEPSAEARTQAAIPASRRILPAYRGVA